MLRQVEVGGDVTTLDLSSLISQSEYQVTVTPGYQSGPGQAMTGSAITGEETFSLFYFNLKAGRWTSDPCAPSLLLFLLLCFLFLDRCGSCPKEPAVFRGGPDLFQSLLGPRSSGRGTLPHWLGQEGRQQLPVRKSIYFLLVSRRDVSQRNEKLLELLEKVLVFSWSVYEGLTDDLLESGSVVTVISI